MSEHYQFRLKSGNTVSFDPGRQELLLHGTDGSARTLSLGYAEARLLGLLLIEPGVIRSRDEILKYAWEERVVAPGNLTQAIFALRNLIEDGRDHEILQTVPRRGYRFNEEYLIDEALVETPADTVAPAQATTATTTEHAIASHGFVVALRGFMAWAVFYLALAGLLGWVVYHRAEIASSLSRDVHVQTVQKGGIAWHFIAEDSTGARAIRDDIAATIDAMPAGANGSIWVNRMFRMYDFSCIGVDGRATELVVSEGVVGQGRLPALLVSCLEGAR